MNTPEDLFKNSFDGYRQEPPEGVWNGISRRLALRKFLKPGLGHFNIYYLAATITAAAIIWNTIGEDPNTQAAGTGTIAMDSAQSRTQSQQGNPTQKLDHSDSNTTQKPPKYSPDLSKGHTHPDTKTAQNAAQGTSKGDTAGLMATSSEPEIQSTSPSQQPMQDFTSAFQASIHNGCAPLDVQLINLSKNTEYCQWNLGNGETTYEQNPTATYDKPGTYIIALRTVNGTYAKTSYDTIKVSARQQAEIAVAINGMTIIAEARNTDNRQVVWDFGDQTQQSGKKRSHTYRQSGTYDLMLTVSDDACTDTVIRRITIKEPEHSITFPNAIIASNSGSIDGNYTIQSPESKSLFGPKGDIAQISRYNLTIYARDGRQLFATNSPRQTWNGYYNGTRLPKGVYVYKCSYEFINGEKATINGNITLLWE